MENSCREKPVRRRALSNVGPPAPLPFPSVFSSTYSAAFPFRLAGEFFLVLEREKNIH